MQVKHHLTTRVDVHGLAQVIGHNAGGVAVQLAQGRVVRGIDQPLVKHQVTANISIELTVIVLATGIERLMQLAQIFVGTAQGSQADGFNLNENILGITLKNEYTICSEIMDSIMRQSDAYFADMPAGSIVTALDGFYTERKNKNIPISWAVWVAVRKNRRDPTLPQFLDELRNLYP